MGEEENPCWVQTTHLSQVVDIDLNCQGHEEFSTTIRGFWDKGLTYVKAKVIKNFSNLYATHFVADSSSACITSLRPCLISAAGVVDSYTGAQTHLAMPGFYPIVHCVSF